MLSGKATAYFMTHSAAILSDAAESVVHVISLAFAAFSLRLTTRPAAPQFLYGYERITFFSEAFEGAMIIVAAITIVVAAVEKWIAGLHFERLNAGTLLVLAAAGLTRTLGVGALVDRALTFLTH
jgi:cation diffusion facilitator family transporter